MAPIETAFAAPYAKCRSLKKPLRFCFSRCVVCPDWGCAEGDKSFAREAPFQGRASERLAAAMTEEMTGLRRLVEQALGRTFFAA